MYWRRFAVSEIPVDDHDAFDAWLTERWREKDELLDQYLKTGRFPADTSERAEESRSEDDYINTEVKLRSIQDVGQIFVALASLAMICRVVEQLWNMLVRRV
jgi:lysocardiolipin and lysophospholipid acyltransferase